MTEAICEARNEGCSVRAQKPPSTRRAKRKSASFLQGSLVAPPVTEPMRSTGSAVSVHPERQELLEAGVLAFRRNYRGKLLVLLVSKRRSGKWGIPKGKVSTHLSFHATAAKEAFEEAGVIGSVSSDPVGVFRAKKRTADTSSWMIEVWVYLMEVAKALPDWPEKRKRKTRWVNCKTAARHLREPVLARLCHQLGQIGIPGSEASDTSSMPAETAPPTLTGAGGGGRAFRFSVAPEQTDNGQQVD